MADITLTPQQVKAAERQQTGLDSPPVDTPKQSDVIMPGARLDVNPDAVPSLNDEVNKSRQERFSEAQLEQIKQLVTPPEVAQPPSDPNGLPRIDELDLNQQSSLPNDPQTPKQSETPITFELPDDDSAKAFKAAFEKYLGFPLEDLKTYSQQYQQSQEAIAQLQAQNYERNSVQSLAQEWGVDYTTAQSRLNSVKERFNQYDQNMQARLDNLEGAKLIWSRLELERNQKSQIPQFQRSSSMSNIGTANDYMFTEKQLDSMSPDEYAQNADRIYQAYAMGLVKPT